MARGRPVLAYTTAPRGLSSNYRNKIVAVLAATVVYTAFLYRSGGARSFLASSTTNKPTKMMASRRLQISTWNIAAINNNPFEYWITYNDAYERLMLNVEEFLENPGERDVIVPQVFSEQMFQDLSQRMTAVGWPSVASYWENDYSKRTIVNGFLKDGGLGKKRLASMPDRITNTIFTSDGTAVFRPTVINMYEEDLSNQDMWWGKWSKFMFDTDLSIKGKEGVQNLKPYAMLKPIKKDKYPAIGEQEEKDSLPLQTLCGAIFDAILVHMMNTVSTPEVWQPLKHEMVLALNKQKVPNTLKILQTQYTDSNIITLQEVSSSFIDMAREGPIGQRYHVLAPSNMDSTRDQNSVILLDRTTFPHGIGEEITAKVTFPKDAKVPVAPGDLLAVTATTVDGLPLVIASFHGDTNGLATKPVLDAVVQAMQRDGLGDHQLVFGMDANTYEHAKPGEQQDVLDFATRYRHHGLTSCWGDTPNPSNYTTYNARTYLQPQLNKACKQSEKRANGDVNPKDFILFPKSSFTVEKTWKDNTGTRAYTEDMAFPTLQFPSDHGILSTVVDIKL